MSGPYIAKGFENQKTLVGNGQCVALVKAFSNAPPSSLWSEGERITPESVKLLQSGTVIATFEKGRYQNRLHGNHAAIFIRTVPGGIRVFDQWTGSPPRERTIRFGKPAGTLTAQRPELFSVVK